MEGYLPSRVSWLLEGRLSRYEITRIFNSLQENLMTNLFYLTPKRHFVLTNLGEKVIFFQKCPCPGYLAGTLPS